MNHVQILESNGKPTFAVIPFEEYERLLAPLQDAVDASDDALVAERIKAVVAGEDEVFPAEVVKALLAGENAVRVLRTYRGTTPAQLAESCGVTREHIYQIESGKRSMSIDVLRKMVAALRVDAELFL